VTRQLDATRDDDDEATLFFFWSMRGAVANSRIALTLLLVHHRAAREHLGLDML
jgi:hypothetical protein